VRLPVGLALVLGALLGAAPFLRYADFGHAFPHSNHDPRHGGRLAMVGDFHLELVARGDRVELFTSDALRRPLHPVEGWVAFDGAAASPLEWRDERMVGAGASGAREANAAVALADGTRLEWRFWLDAR
jgi:hypothetical protein